MVYSIERQLIMMKIEKYTIGVGDRFGRQGKAQLQALALARQAGLEVCQWWRVPGRGRHRRDCPPS